MRPIDFSATLSVTLEPGDRALVQAVVGDVADAEPGRGRDPAVGDVDAVEQHLAGGDRPLPGDDLAQLLLAVAVDPGDAEDLAAVQLEREIMQRGSAAVVPSVEMRRAAQSDERRISPRTSTRLLPASLTAGASPRGWEPPNICSTMRWRTLSRFAPDMTSGPSSPALRPCAQDRDAVADRQRLAELVGDEHHGDALVAQAAQEIEQRRRPRPG